MEIPKTKVGQAPISTFEDKCILSALSDDSYAPQSLRLRAQIILLALKGMRSKAISRELQVNVLTVRKWIHRFHQFGLAGINDSVRRRAPLVKVI